MINHNAIFKWSCWQNNECMFYVLYRKKTGKDSTGWINTAVSLMWVLIVGVYITSKLIMNNIIYYGKDFSFMLPPSFFTWWWMVIFQSQYKKIRVSATITQLLETNLGLRPCRTLFPAAQYVAEYHSNERKKENISSSCCKPSAKSQPQFQRQNQGPVPKHKTFADRFQSWIRTSVNAAFSFLSIQQRFVLRILLKG